MNKYLTRQSPGIEVFHQDGNPHDEYYRHADGSRGAESWKLDVGAECNALLELAESFAKMQGINRRLHLEINSLNATERSVTTTYRQSELCNQLSKLIADNSTIHMHDQSAIIGLTALHSIVQRVAEFEELETV